MITPTILFAIAVTVHNLEEILSPLELPAAIVRLGVTRRDHQVAIVALTLALYSVVAAAFMTSAAVRALAGCAAVMVLNAFVPHTLLTVVRRRYAPGALSGLLLTVPAGIALLFTLVGSGLIAPSGILGAAIVVGLVAVLLIVVAIGVSAMVRRALNGG